MGNMDPTHLRTASAGRDKRVPATGPRGAHLRAPDAASEIEVLVATSGGIGSSPLGHRQLREDGRGFSPFPPLSKIQGASCYTTLVRYSQVVSQASCPLELH